MYIDKFSRKPIYEQLIEQFELMISSGELCMDKPLPSVRALSEELCINPNTLQKAYAEMEKRGICYSTPGSGRFLAKDALLAVDNARKIKLGKLGEQVRDLLAAGVTRKQIEEQIERIYKEANV